jgi:hypothetical protein
MDALAPASFLYYGAKRSWVREARQRLSIHVVRLTREPHREAQRGHLSWLTKATKASILAKKQRRAWTQ